MIRTYLPTLALIIASIPLMVGCGSASRDASSKVKIINGNFFNTQDLQYRYQVAILSCNRTPSGLVDLLDGAVCGRKCTGTIMKSNKILTAAHCLNDPNTDYVATYHGSQLDGRSWKVGAVAYPFNTSSTNFREGENGEGYLHDLAMLTLDSEIPLGSTQLAAALSVHNPLGQTAYVGGAGAHDTLENVHYYLKWREAKIDEVDLILQKIVLHHDYTDRGDSGSGIFTYIGNQAYVHGVLSSSIDPWPFDYTYYTYLNFAHYPWVQSQL